MKSGYIVAEFKKPFAVVETGEDPFRWRIVDADNQHVLNIEDYIIGEMVAEGLDLFPEAEDRTIRFGVEI